MRTAAGATKVLRILADGMIGNSMLTVYDKSHRMRL